MFTGLPGSIFGWFCSARTWQLRAFPLALAQTSSRVSDYASRHYHAADRSLIGRIWGIEGTITLFKGEPPTNRLLVDNASCASTMSMES